MFFVRVVVPYIKKTAPLPRRGGGSEAVSLLLTYGILHKKCLNVYQMKKHYSGLEETISHPKDPLLIAIVSPSCKTRASPADANASRIASSS